MVIFAVLFNTSRIMAKIRISAKIDENGDLKKLGEAIKDVRKNLTAKFSQEQLAFESGVDRGHMGKIERGESNLTLLNLLKISQALKCKAYEILQKADL